MCYRYLLSLLEPEALHGNKSVLSVDLIGSCLASNLKKIK